MVINSELSGKPSIKEKGGEKDTGEGKAEQSQPAPETVSHESQGAMDQM